MLSSESAPSFDPSARAAHPSQLASRPGESWARTETTYDEETFYLDELYARAEQAYQIARREVFDQLAPGTPIDLAELSEYQRTVLLDLRQVEEEMQLRRKLGHMSLGWRN